MNLKVGDYVVRKIDAQDEFLWRTFCRRNELSVRHVHTITKVVRDFVYLKDLEKAWSAEKFNLVFLEKAPLSSYL